MKSNWGGDKGGRAGALIGIPSINNSNEVNPNNNKRCNGNNQINIDLIEPGVMIQSIQPNIHKSNVLWNSYVSIDNDSKISND